MARRVVCQEGRKGVDPNPSGGGLRGLRQGRVRGDAGGGFRGLEEDAGQRWRASARPAKGWAGGRSVCTDALKVGRQSSTWTREGFSQTAGFPSSQLSPGRRSLLSVDKGGTPSE